MAFELTPELTETLKLTPEQVTGVTEFGTSTITGLQDSWGTELETKITERTNTTFEGATKKIEKESGIARNHGEVASDYIARVNETAFSDLRTKAETKLAAAEQALLDASKDGASKEELTKLREDIKGFQTKAADYDKLVEDDVVGKYATSKETIQSLQHELAFTNARPKFSDDVNTFEADAKWGQFVAKANEMGSLEKVDKDWVIIDKNNPAKVTKISDLVAKDETISGLINGRTQEGIGNTSTENVTVNGVPFELPKDATPTQRAEAIRGYLKKEGLNTNMDSWGAEYSKWNNKILNPEKK
jgi:hypothetical protein